MSLHLMKERAKVSGTTPREEMIRDGQNLLKEELEHDSSYSPTMFFYDSDNKVDDRLANLRVYGRKNSSLNGNYMNFLTTYDNPIKIGDYIHDTKDDTYWLVYNSFNVNDVHYEGKLIQCNYPLKWQLSNGKVVERWANIVSASKYDTGETGNATITAANYLSEDEFVPFAKWLYGRLNTLKAFMKERTNKYHANITSYNGVSLSKPIMRHTPAENLNIWMITDFMNQVDSSALSGIYNQQLLSIGGYELVNYWQSIAAPKTVQVVPNILNVDGTCYTPEQEGEPVPVTCENVIGILFDDEALGITIMNEDVRSIENPRGRYFNNWYNWVCRYYNDQTENFVHTIIPMVQTCKYILL